jgi:hypothetical protein
MDKKQMEMLSVKSAIERMVQNYISTYTTTGSYKEFFDAVERLVASFYVGHQIDNNYLVRSVGLGLEIAFTTKGHGTRITFMLPENLRWKVSVAKPQQPDTGTMEYDTRSDKVRMYDGSQWVEVSSDDLLKQNMKPRDAVLEGTIRVGATGGLEIYKNGRWVQLPRQQTPQVATPDPTPSSEPLVKEEFDPYEAYERAKKAVRNMS